MLDPLRCHEYQFWLADERRLPIQCLSHASVESGFYLHMQWFKATAHASSAVLMSTSSVISAPCPPHSTTWHYPQHHHHRQQLDGTPLLQPTNPSRTSASASTLGEKRARACNRTAAYKCYSVLIQQHVGPQALMRHRLTVTTTKCAAAATDSSTNQSIMHQR